MATEIPLTPTPSILCRCCGEPLHVFTQPALVPWKRDTFNVECHNPTCAMKKQTFDSRNYPFVDLDLYIHMKAAAS